MDQWLRLYPSNTRGASLIPGQGTKVPHAVWPNNDIKKFFLIIFKMLGIFGLLWWLR